MATQAKSSYGTIVTIGAVPIPELRNISDVGFAVTMTAVDAHDGNGWGSSIPSLKRGKPMPIEFHWVPANAAHLALLNAALNSTSVAITVVHPVTGNPTWTFQAFVGDFSIPTNPVEGALIARTVITPDGVMALA